MRAPWAAVPPARRQTLAVGLDAHVPGGGVGTPSRWCWRRSMRKRQANCPEPSTVAQANSHGRVRSGLAAGGKEIRTVGPAREVIACFLGTEKGGNRPGVRCYGAE